MKRISIIFAVLAAICYGISSPIAKILLEDVPPLLMASMLYLGAGFGMLTVNVFRAKRTRQKEARITKKELPFTFAMLALDIAAPIFLMLGLTMTTSATASLLGNFEIVATTAIALIAFKEAVGRRMWIAALFITAASVILSVEDFSKLSFSLGSILVLSACICWGIENNCTSKLSLKDPLQIVVIKGIGSGVVSLLIALLTGERASGLHFIIPALLLGFFAYGLSVYFYILAQRGLGASRTSAFYAFAPFVGVGLSFVLFREAPTISFAIALAVMAVGAYFAAYEKHEHIHSHTEVEHEHRHRHDDGHHDHIHPQPIDGEHNHTHVHTAVIHKHAHTPDLHHVHKH
ncbi:MAG: DMT family transporter [Oscillospiraceae bacterium]|jgi:drug/metabolite transporter (DMT)-like permease|nr:DMT family transporter [Oscillospiraceae bacterium]